MARRRGERIKVYVETDFGKYGFQTQETVHTAMKSETGQVKFVSAAGVFFGANSPKPYKATQINANGKISTFCSDAKAKELRTKDGWEVSKRRVYHAIKASASSQPTVSVYVPMPGTWNYAWNITSAEFANYATILGLEEADGSTRNTLVWGVNDPKPPRAMKKIQGRTVSSFMKPSAAKIAAAVAEGWSVSAVEYDLDA